MHKNLRQIVSPFQRNGIPITDEQEITNLDKEAIQHNIWQLFYSQLARTNARRTNTHIDAFLIKKKRSYLFSATTFLKQQAVQVSLLHKMKQAGIPAVILKGSSLTTLIYRNTHSRLSCDIDILVKKTDIDKAHTLMLANDYVCSSEAELAFWVLRLHHIAYRQKSSSRDTPIEIHWNFTIPGFFNLSSEEIWQEVEYDDQGNALLKPKMMLIQLLLHHHRHAFQEFRNLIDLFWAFYRYDTEIDWLDFVTTIERIGLLKTSHLTCHQIMQNWPEDSGKLSGFRTFKNVVDTRCSSNLLLGILRRQTTDFEERAFSTRQKLVYRMSLDRWHTIVLSFVKTLLPPPEAIKELYKDPSNTSLFGNYLNYYRWRFFKIRK